MTAAGSGRAGAAAADGTSEGAAQLRPASRTLNVSSSAVREILKITQRPDVISLAGGLSAPGRIRTAVGILADLVWEAAPARTVASRP